VVTRRRIAVVGSGIAGLTAGYVLSRTDDVVLYEAADRLGGHAHTHRVCDRDGRDVFVDSGFIVHNRLTYPLFSRLLSELGVPVQCSEMSMSVSCAGCGLHYAGHRGVPGLAAGLRRGGGQYAAMLTEVLRFHRAARRLVARAGRQGDQEPTLAQFLQAGRYSQYFVAHFVSPFVAAVWSCPPATALRYPARYLFAFLGQHGLLTVTGSPPWLTISGGSRGYVERVRKQLTTVRTGCAVTAISRTSGGARLSYTDARGGQHDDGVAAIVVATHPDQALRLLTDPTAAERSVLGSFHYTPNQAVLHTDATVLPAAPRVRSSWNYSISSCSLGDSQPQVSYYLNRLQRLAASRDYVVTLNPARPIPPSRVLARMAYTHPVYDPVSVAAQRRLPELNDGVTAYAGAYHGWGFHEDGCRAGLSAAESLGGRW